MSRIGRHLISIDDLDRQGMERILDRAESFAEVSGREIKKVPRCAGEPSSTSSTRRARARARRLSWRPSASAPT
jgi:Aspartate carbamoyltransferase, catalytic chain